MIAAGAAGVAPIQLDAPMALQAQGSGEMVQASESVAKVMCQMRVAKACPRDEIKAIDKAKMQCTRPRLAAMAMYSYNRGGTQVEGPSTRLIETVAACWGNIDSGYMIVERGADYTKIKAFCTDLETNTTKTREETIKHYRSLKGGQKKLLTDERDIREYVASWAVRAERACQEKVIPRDVIEECMEVCNQTMSMDSQNTDPEKIKALVNAFSEFGVTPQMLSKKIGYHIEDIKTPQVIMLRKIYQSLKDGYSSVDQAFPTDPSQEAKGTVVPPKSQSDKVADAFGLKKGSADVKVPEKKAVKTPSIDDLPDVE